MNITAREYFAAHAPTDIPDWFPAPQEPVVRIPDRLSMAQADPRYGNLSNEGKERLRQWLRDGCYDLPGAAGELGEAVNVRHAELLAQAQEADRERARRRFIGWRWTYADMMLGMAGNSAPGADADRMRLGLSAILMIERDPTSPVTEKVRSMAHTARRALESRP